MKTELMGQAERDAYYALEVRRALQARVAQLPGHIAKQLTDPPSRHWFAFRTAAGLALWYECWCDSPAVIQNKNEQAKQYVRQGFAAAFMDTRFSTRCAGKRRPLILVPPSSQVDIKALLQKLVGAKFQGPTGHALIDYVKL